ncbi:MAG: glycosyltransferase family 2 protein [Bacteroidetes bacterium]|nr:MAG: glycosyltransferase family 2 protein [Bacteroidota bacterium]
MPELSVLLCTYNSRQYLPDAVNSVLRSEGVDLELILVNDGSTDGTEEYTNSIRDSRVKVIHLDENRGIAEAANVGLRHCSTKYIARMDSDDLCSPDRLKAQLEFLEAHPEFDVVCTKVELTDADFRQDGYKLYVDWCNGLMTHELMYAHRYRDSPIVNPSACYRKSAIDRFGDYKTGVPEDYEFWLRLFEGGVKMAKLDRVGLVWRDHSHRLTRNHSDYSDSAFSEVKLDYLRREWASRFENRPVYIWGKSRNARDWHMRLTESGLPVAGFVDFTSGTWKGLPLLSIDEGLKLKGAFFLITVRNRVGGPLIQEALEERGMEAGEDFYFM